MDDYDIGRYLGRGAFAMVHAARDRRTGRRVAIKMINISSSSSSSPRTRAFLADIVKREIDIHRSISSEKHPCIVELYESFRVSSDITAMVMEYCPLGDLQSYLKRVRAEMAQTTTKTKDLDQSSSFISEGETSHVMKQILSGLAYLHGRGIVHRDIKPRNILLCVAEHSLGSHNSDKKGDKTGANITPISLWDITAKIGDFGVAVQMADDDDWDNGQHTLCGTPSCLAPEVALSAKLIGNKNAVLKEDIRNVNNNRMSSDDDDGTTTGHGQPVDLWSSGCILYSMLVGKYPFSSSPRKNKKNKTPNNNLSDTIESLRKRHWSIPDHLLISDDARCLLNQLLSFNPANRGTAKDILEYHSFFQQIRDASCPSSSFDNDANDNSHIHRHSQQDHKHPPKPKPKEASTVRAKCVGFDNHDKSSFRVQLNERYDNHPTYSKSDPTPYNSIENIQLNSKDPLNSQRCKNDKQQNLPMPKIEYMDDLHRLPSLKHSWQEVQEKECHQRTKYYTLFLLPHHTNNSSPDISTDGGLVLHRQSSHRPGIFLHITNDGRRAYLGTLAAAADSSSMTNHTEKQIKFESLESLSKEAFSRAPPHIRELAKTRRAAGHYQPLSLLFKKHKKSFPKLYDTLRDIVMSVKKLTPKITLYLYDRGCSEETQNDAVVSVHHSRSPVKDIDINDTENSSTTTTTTTKGLVAKTMLMENGPLPDVVTSFVDGTTIRYPLSSGNAMLRLPPSNDYKDKSNENILTIQLGSINNNVDLDDTRDTKTRYGHLLNVAQTATDECLATERMYESSLHESDVFPIVKKMMMADEYNHSWITLSTTIAATNGHDNNRHGDIATSSNAPGENNSHDKTDLKVMSLKDCLLDHIDEEDASMTSLGTLRSPRH